MRASVGSPTIRAILFAVAALTAAEPALAIDFGYDASGPSLANWPMTPVQTLAPDQSPTLPNTSSFTGGVYVDYSWSFPTHGGGNPMFVYTMTLPFADTTHDGMLPPAPDGSPNTLGANDYTESCNGAMVGSTYTTSRNGNRIATPQFACTLYNAPSFDAATLVDALGSVGWNFTFVFPIADPGTGKALVFWSSDPIDALNGLPPQHQGVARVYNINWQNQFPSTDVANCVYGPSIVTDSSGNIKTVTTCNTDGTTTTFPHADAIGAFIDGLPSPFRETTFRGYQMLSGGTPDPSTGTTAYPYAVVVTDSWVTTPIVAAKLPTPATIAAGATATSMDIGIIGNGAGVGKGSAIVATTNVVVPFDYAKFCSDPGKSGLPRSQTWINNCIEAGARAAAQ